MITFLIPLDKIYLQCNAKSIKVKNSWANSHMTVEVTDYLC